MSVQKKERIQLRISKTQKQRMEKQAARQGISLSAWIRKVAIHEEEKSHV